MAWLGLISLGLVAEVSVIVVLGQGETYWHENRSADLVPVDHRDGSTAGVSPRARPPGHRSR